MKTLGALQREATTARTRERERMSLELTPPRARECNLTE